MSLPSPERPVRLIQTLARIAREELLAEKWLIAPTHRVGHQWIDAMTRGGQPALNLRVKTLKNMALDLAGPEMVRQGLRLVSDQGATILIDGIWNRVRACGTKGGLAGSYLAPLPVTGRFLATLYGAVKAMRLAGLEPGKLEAGCFEVAEKGQELARVYAEYLKELRAAKLIDYAEVLRLAKERLQDGIFPRGEMAPLVLIPDGTWLQAQEEALVQALPRGRRLAVDAPVAAGKAPGTPLGDLDLLRWLSHPEQAPAPARDGRVTFFSAVGEVNEVREVFRRIKENGWPLDEVELVYPDTETYVPLVYEISLRCAEEGVAATFCEGIPVCYSRPGRALRAWVAWVRGEYPQAILVRMLQDGLLLLPEGVRSTAKKSRTVPPPGGGRLAQALRRAPIGWQRERYLPALDGLLSNLEQAGRADACPRRGEDGEDRPRNLARLGQLWEGVEAVRGLVTELLQATPSAGSRPLETLRGAQVFLEKFCRCRGESDTYSRRKLVDEIADVIYWVSFLGEEGQAREVPVLDAWEWLAQLPAAMKVEASGPRPGRLYAAPLQGGGHSGRRHTFIVGLDDSRFPGAGTQDPLLLDREKDKLSRAGRTVLPTAAFVLQRRLEEFGLLLARLRGQVVFSFSLRQLADDRETFPSPVLLPLFRLVSGHREADQEAFLKALPPPASFAADAPARCLDPGDWWLWRLSQGAGIPEGTDAALAARYPHAVRGRRAEAARRGKEFTPYDGRVAEAGRDRDPFNPKGTVFSASSLQDLGSCPLRYYFKKVLEVEPPEDREIDPSCWLDPREKGTLLHEVFRAYLAGLAKKDLAPEYARDEKTLLALLKRETDRLAREVPPPSTAVLEKELAELRRTVLVFLREEEDLAQEGKFRPRYLEAALGMASEGEGTALDTPDPVGIRLPGGMIRARGRIDRVDSVGGVEGEGPYAIWDYKTGSSFRYQDADPFRQGRLVQPALYLKLLEARLREIYPGRKNAVAQFGYFFPDWKAGGERIVRTPEALAGGGEVLTRLCRIAATGAFLATDHFKEDCEYCDYQAVCGDTAQVARDSRAKLDHEANAELADFRELRKGKEEDDE